MTTTSNQSRSSAPKPLTGTPSDTGAKPPAKQAKPTAGNVRKARPKAAHNPITSLPKTPSRDPKKPSPRGASFPGITPEAIRRRKEEDELKLRAAGLTGPPAQLKPPTPPNGPPPPGDAEALQPISLDGDKLAGSDCLTAHSGQLLSPLLPTGSDYKALAQPSRSRRGKSMNGSLSSTPPRLAQLHNAGLQMVFVARMTVHMSLRPSKAAQRWQLVTGPTKMMSAQRPL